MTTDKRFVFCIEHSSAHLETKREKKGNTEAKDALGKQRREINTSKRELALDTVGVIFSS